MSYHEHNVNLSTKLLGYMHCSQVASLPELVQLRSIYHACPTMFELMARLFLRYMYCCTDSIYGICTQNSVIAHSGSWSTGLQDRAAKGWLPARCSKLPAVLTSSQPPGCGAACIDLQGHMSV